MQNMMLKSLYLAMDTKMGMDFLSLEAAPIALKKTKMIVRVEIHYSHPFLKNVMLKRYQETIDIFRTVLNRGHYLFL